MFTTEKADTKTIQRVVDKEKTRKVRLLCQFDREAYQLYVGLSYMAVIASFCLFTSIFNGLGWASNIATIICRCSMHVTEGFCMMLCIAREYGYCKNLLLFMAD